MIKPASGLKLGTENKKQVYILGGLAAVAAIIFSINFFSGGGESESPVAKSRTSVSTLNLPADGALAEGATPKRRRTSGRADLRPVPWRLGPGKAGAHDTGRIDPTLRLDLLARLQTVDSANGGRNLFQMHAVPDPAAQIKNPPKIHPTGPTDAAAVAPATPPGSPPPPVAPTIELKYYGYTTAKGQSRRKAFLLDGEDIIVAFEGETVKRRYRVVKVNATSIVMEDTQFNSTQTLPLQPENNG